MLRCCVVIQIEVKLKTVSYHQKKLPSSMQFQSSYGMLCGGHHLQGNRRRSDSPFYCIPGNEILRRLILLPKMRKFKFLIWRAKKNDEIFVDFCHNFFCLASFTILSEKELCFKNNHLQSTYLPKPLIFRNSLILNICLHLLI